MDNKYRYLSALEDFRNARWRANLSDILAHLTGQPTRLLSYDEVRKKLKAQVGRPRGLQDISLDQIVGSVNRYEDFTRNFLPRQGIESHRWARVMAAGDSPQGLPPIDVYQIGDVYFVKDGNHRVSVARQRGDAMIQANVTEIKTAVPLSPDDSPDDLIIKGECVEFLENTHLDSIRPDADLTVTAPGQYAQLEEHIRIHRYLMGIDYDRPIPLDEAVAHWYDTVYLPVVRMVRQRGLLKDFPQRTEADLYLWLLEYRAQLADALGVEIPAEDAATDLATRHSPRPERVAARLSESMLDAVFPDALESGPPPGAWRQRRASAHTERLFADVLVAVSGESAPGLALEQALILARLDGAQLHGLHVLPAHTSLSGPDAQTLQTHFKRCCREERLEGTLNLVAGGKLVNRLLERARWNDLIVLHLSDPPADQPLLRLHSGIRNLIQRSPVPILIVPEHVSSLTHALLAYDGSPKAQEALYVATYLTARWELSLSVLMILQENRVTVETQERAKDYLDQHGIQAEMITARGSIPSAILMTAETSRADLILMGAYGHGPLLNVFLDNVVDQVLRSAHRPVLLCR